MGNWHLKSKDVDLLFCVTEDCNVITFRESIANLCPKCHAPGSLVRSAKVLPLGIRR
jgi:hypothetical protein